MKYSEETRQEAIARYATGDSRKKISKDMGISASTIYFWLRQAEANMRPLGARPLPVDARKQFRVADLRRQGKSYKQISEQTGISIWKVRQITKDIPKGGN